MSSTPPIQRGQRYRRAILVVFAVGIVGYVGGAVADQHLAGIVIYAVAGLGGLAATLYGRRSSAVRMLDERDRRLQERASHTVITLFAYVGLPAFIGLFLLDATGQYAFGPTVAGVLYAFSALYLAWGVAYLVARYRT